MLNVVLRFVPTSVTAPMTTTAINATINPYSMAVAPALGSDEPFDAWQHSSVSESAGKRDRMLQPVAPKL